MASSGRTRRHLDIWPGYVDVLSTLLMVIIFTLMVFVIAQFSSATRCRAATRRSPSYPRR